MRNKQGGLHGIFLASEWLRDRPKRCIDMFFALGNRPTPYNTPNHWVCNRGINAWVVW